MTESVVAVAIFGESRMVAARIRTMPVKADDRGGFRFAYPDFGSDFFPELWRQLPLADRAGPPWRRHDTCSTCGSVLEGAARAERISVEMALSRVSPFDVELTLPMTRCPSCGDLQVIERGTTIESNLSEALVRGFDAARVRP